MTDICVYCGETLYPDDEVIHNTLGVAHWECSEREDPEELD